MNEELKSKGYLIVRGRVVRKYFFEQFYFTDWDGKRKKKWKKGFRTKGEASEWGRTFILKAEGTAEKSLTRMLSA